jgi:four helix bundle protein
MMGQSFKDLIVWQRSIQLTVAVYKLTAQFPDAERFGLTNQLRRASVSIASNIAEGYGKSTKGEYLLFLGHARGSCAEVETQLIIAKELGFGTTQDRATSTSLCDEVGKMLVALIKSLHSAKPLKS